MTVHTLLKKDAQYRARNNFHFDWKLSPPPLVWLIVCTVQTYNDLVLSFSEGGKLIFSQLFFIWIHTYIFANQWLNDNNTLVLFSPTHQGNCSIFYSWKYVSTYKENKVRKFLVSMTDFIHYHLILLMQWWASFIIWSNACVNTISKV